MPTNEEFIKEIFGIFIGVYQKEINKKESLEDYWWKEFQKVKIMDKTIRHRIFSKPKEMKNGSIVNDKEIWTIPKKLRR